MTDVSIDQANSATSLEGDYSSVAPRLCKAIADAIKASSRSRFDVAGLLSEMLGRNISKNILDRWLGEASADYRIPAEAIIPLCRILGTHGPLVVLTQALGCELLGPNEARELKILKLRLQQREISEQLRLLEGDV